MLALVLATHVLLQNAEIHACFAGVLAKGAYTESAAFLVLKGERYDCVAWPTLADSHRARYRGEVPPGAVGIIHSHPRGDTLPSPRDVAEAKRLGMPVYVVTRDGVSMAEPWEGTSIVLTRDSRWSR